MDKETYGKGVNGCSQLANAQLKRAGNKVEFQALTMSKKKKKRYMYTTVYMCRQRR